jgi:hypothetical protein
MAEQAQRSARLLTRGEASAFLRELGYPVAAKTLQVMVSRGGGPQYRRFGKRALYNQADLVSWAENRCSPPRASRSE